MSSRVGPSRKTYQLFNWCRNCGIFVAKNIIKCPDCHYKVRTKPRGKAFKMRKEENLVRY